MIPLLLYFFQKADIIAVKTLLAFGAMTFALNRYKQTPLDLLPEQSRRFQLSTVLESLHAKPGSKVGKREKREVNRLHVLLHTLLIILNYRLIVY